jgi:hypothetical protein
MTTVEPRTTITVATTLARTAPPTWSASEILPGGGERPIVDHLRWTERQAYRFDDRTWNVIWREDATPLA